MTLHLGAAGIVAVLSLATVAAGLLAIHAGLLSPLAGFGIAMIAWLGGGCTALVLALISLRSSQPAWGGLALALIMLLPALVPARQVLQSPRIHDISTDLVDPPRFTTLAADPANAGRDLTYPEGDPDSAALQRLAYPDIVGEVVAVTPGEALATAAATAAQLGWQLRSRDDAELVLEATASSTLFGFVDDVVVRVRPSPQGARVDVRSTSRVGRSDLGANAARIRRFLAELRRQLPQG